MQSAEAALSQRQNSSSKLLFIEQWDSQCWQAVMEKSLLALITKRYRILESIADGPVSINFNFPLLQTCLRPYHLCINQACGLNQGLRCAEEIPEPSCWGIHKTEINRISERIQSKSTCRANKHEVSSLICTSASALSSPSTCVWVISRTNDKSLIITITPG